MLNLRDFEKLIDLGDPVYLPDVMDRRFFFTKNRNKHLLQHILVFLDVFEQTRTMFTNKLFLNAFKTKKLNDPHLKFLEKVKSTKLKFFTYLQHRKFEVNHWYKEIDGFISKLYFNNKEEFFIKKYYLGKWFKEYRQNYDDTSMEDLNFLFEETKFINGTEKAFIQFIKNNESIKEIELNFKPINLDVLHIFLKNSQFAFNLSKLTINDIIIPKKENGNAVFKNKNLKDNNRNFNALNLGKEEYQKTYNKMLKVFNDFEEFLPLITNLKVFVFKNINFNSIIPNVLEKEKFSQYLNNGLKSMISLEVLTLDNLYLEPSDFNLILGSILFRLQKLKILTINNSKIGESATNELAEHLKSINNKSLIELNLKNNNLGKDGIVKIANKLRNNKYLLNLNLSFNVTDEKEVYDFFTEVAHLKKLNSLTFHSNINIIPILKQTIEQAKEDNPDVTYDILFSNYSLNTKDKQNNSPNEKNKKNKK